MVSRAGDPRNLLKSALMNLHNQWLTKSPPFCLGHRGFPARARENTLPSFLAAMEAGAHGVELDVYVTRDGVPVVHHNAAAWTGEEELILAQLTWDELEPLSFVVDHESYQVATLTSVLDGIGPEAMVNVEIKPPLANRAAMTVEQILPVIAPHPNILVSSFDAEILRLTQELESTVPLGFLFDSLQALDPWPELPPVFALHPHKDCVDEAFMERVGRYHHRIFTWTVDDPQEAESLLALGVDGLISNRPDLIAPTC